MLTTCEAEVREKRAEADTAHRRRRPLLRLDYFSFSPIRRGTLSLWRAAWCYQFIDEPRRKHQESENNGDPKKFEREADQHQQNADQLDGYNESHQSKDKS
jgi:hypothetical protein